MSIGVQVSHPFIGLLWVPLIGGGRFPLIILTTSGHHIYGL
jgi:hypothetical protein